MSESAIIESNMIDYTTIEHWLVEIWEELLEVQDIDATSDFFELGTDSLTVIRFLHRVEQKFGKNIIQLDDLFKHSILSEVAKRIESSCAQ